MTELAQFSAEFAGIGDLLERQAADIAGPMDWGRAAP